MTPSLLEIVADFWACQSIIAGQESCAGFVVNLFLLENIFSSIIMEKKKNDIRIAKITSRAVFHSNDKL